MARRSPVYLVMAGLIAGFLLASFTVPILGVDLGGSSDNALVGTGGGFELGDGGGFVDGGSADGSADGGGFLDDTTDDGTSTPGGTAGPGSGPVGVGGGQGGSGGGTTGGTGGGGGGTGGGGTGGSGGGDVELIASDQGVTPTTVRMGFVILDLAGAEALGIDGGAIDTESQKREIQAYVREINENGGLHGRQIEAFFANYDPVADATGSTTAQNACVRFTEDIKVFAVYAMEGGWSANQCVTKQHDTIMLHAGVTLEEDALPQNGKGLMFTTRMLLVRQSANAMALANQLGEFAGQNRLFPGQPRKIGVMYDEGTGGFRAVATEQGIIPALQQLGHTVTARVKLAGDPGTAAGQIPVAINDFRTKQVDTVVVASQVVYMAQWIQQARNQGYNPRYVVTGDGANDFTGNQASGGGQWSALGIVDTDTNNVRAGRPVNPKLTDCLARYEALTGEEAPGEENAGRIRIGHLCTLLDEFARAFRAAGPNPTRVDVARQLESRGEFPSGSTGLARWAPGDYGGAEAIKASEWNPACPDGNQGCFLPVSEFYVGPF